MSEVALPTMSLWIMTCARCGNEGLRITAVSGIHRKPGYVVCRRCAEKEGWDFSTEDTESEETANG